MGQVVITLDDQQGRLTPALSDFLRTFVVPGSRCLLSVDHESGRTVGRWLRGHGCEQVNVELHGARSLPYPVGSFDAAILVGTFDHLEAPDLVAADLHRVLRSGGVLLATIPNHSYWRRRLGRGPRQPGSFTPQQLRAVLLQAGFALVGIEGHDGAILRDLPLLGHLSSRASSPPYRVAERLIPGLLGRSIGAFAIRA